MGSNLLSQCPPPFLDASDFPYTGGQNGSRLCSALGGSSICCLPCPLTDWVYPDNFKTISISAEWVALGSVVCCVFMLVSFAVLPVQRTSRHYLTACLVAAVGLLTLSFIIPLGAQPAQCHDAITPNDMRSETACAFSGALVLFGGMASVMWVFIRSLSLHLQICWQIIPGKRFFVSALLVGWGFPILILGLALALSGVSYRFGSICHINHDNSIGSFWGPLLGFAGVTFILQFATLGYCIRVYLRSLADPGTTSATSSHAPSSALPSFSGSIRTVSARAAYRRVRKVISLQWRGITVVLILIISTTYFSIIFLKLDSSTIETIADPAAALPWVLCLLSENGNKDACLGYLSELVVNEAAVAAVLYLIASMGFWCVLFLGRWSMFKGWWDLIRRPFTAATDHWVSADARRLSDPRNYEMLTAPPQHYYMAKGPQGLVAKPSAPGSPKTPYSPSGFAKDKELEGAMDGPIARDFSPSTQGYYAATPALQEPPAAATAGGGDLSHRQDSMNFSRPQRSASQSTATRVTFSRDGGQAVAPSSPLASPTDFYTPKAFATPEANPAHASSIYSQDRGDYFGGSGGAGGGAAGALGRRRELETERSGSALGRHWQGHGSAQLERSGSALSGRTSLGSTREWDPRTTFARGSGGAPAAGSAAAAVAAAAAARSASRGRDGALSPGR